MPWRDRQARRHVLASTRRFELARIEYAKIVLSNLMKGFALGSTAFMILFMQNAETDSDRRWYTRKKRKRRGWVRGMPWTSPQQVNLYYALQNRSHVA